ncbi:ribosome-binding protein 1 [Babesia caballi]|uniref:Ribosome-binding protein 1 n=1 Tax=Babesia caballi TaxID=5871 RepID=A0AAV4M2E3_BABCB|nr:ribosome-binding protein 1 [Babesia caballi]
MASGSESGSCEGRQIKEPKTLKDALDFFGALNGNITLVGLIAAKLKQKAGVYFKTDALINGVYDMEECLKEVIGAASIVRKYIVKITYKSNYGYYGLLMSGIHCVDTCADFILNILQTLHVTLYYLYFRVDTSLRRRGGSSWSLFKCNEKGEDLFRWLTAQNSDTTASANNTKAKMLLGGYSDESELSRRPGYQVGQELSTIVDSESSEGHLPDLLLALCFTTAFTRAGTAAVLSFIGAFCTAVNNKTLRNTVVITLQLEGVCSKLLPKLKPFTVPPADETAPITSVFKGNENEYETLLRNETCSKYVDWLKDKFPALIIYLSEMQKECGKWDPDYCGVHNAGPFAYGFMFGGAWGNRENEVYESVGKLPMDVASLIGNSESSTEATLSSLWKCIDPDKYKWPVPSAAAEPTIGTITQPSGDAPAQSSEKVETVSKSQSVQVSAEAAPTSLGQYSEPYRATQSPSISSSSSGADPSASGASTQPAEHTTPASDTSDRSTGSHDSSASGNTAFSRCLSEDSCPHQSHNGAAEGSTGSSASTDDANTDVTNSQSTITIGGATGGAAVLGGGCAALYFLNVGGIKTLITGVP